MDPERAYSLVTSSYYRGMEDEVTVLALNHAMTALERREWTVDWHFVYIQYVFCRIAQISAPHRKAFEALLSGLSGRRAEFVRIVVDAPDSATFPNALDRPVTAAYDLDLLWAEFFVSGASEPVLRIVRTLDWEDQARRRLLAWLQKRPLFGRSKRQAAVEKLASAGLRLDLNGKRILSEGDLDCLCGSIGKRGFPIFELLPYSVAEQDRNAVFVKGAALWSLKLNSRDHEIVRTICAEERDRPGGLARLRLTEPAFGLKPFSL